MAYYTVRYSYTTVRTRLEFSETDLRTVSGYDQFAVNSSQVEFLLTVRIVCVTDQETATYPTCVGVARV